MREREREQAEEAEEVEERGGEKINSSPKHHIQVTLWLGGFYTQGWYISSHIAWDLVICAIHSTESIAVVFKAYLSNFHVSNQHAVWKL